MARDVTRRIKNYQRKMNVDYIARQLELQKQDMIQRNAEAQAAIDAAEEKARGILGECGLPTMDYPKYLNFVRQLWKLQRNFTGATLRNEAAVIMFKWSHRGADPEILERLARDVFSIEKPEVQKAKAAKEKAAMKKGD